jgi:hypothetical protein
VFSKVGPQTKRCYRNKVFTPLSAGCHSLQILYAQHPGQTKQGITFKVRKHHTWKYAATSAPSVKIIMVVKSEIVHTILPLVKDKP